MHLRVIIGRYLRIWSCAVVFMSFLSACQSTDLPSFGQTTTTGETAQNDPGRSDPQKKGRSEGTQFAEFSDIPIPANAEIDFDNLLVLGAEDGWIGRLAMTTGYKMSDMYTFYEREMPRFGWTKITSIRSATSAMTYSRGDRIATITLQSRTIGGTAINFTVAPANPRAGESTLPSNGAIRN